MTIYPSTNATHPLPIIPPDGIPCILTVSGTPHDSTIINPSAPTVRKSGCAPCLFVQSILSIFLVRLVRIALDPRNVVGIDLCLLAIIIIDEIIEYLSDSSRWQQCVIFHHVLHRGHEPSLPKCVVFSSIHMAAIWCYSESYTCQSMSISTIQNCSTTMRNNQHPQVWLSRQESRISLSSLLWHPIFC